MASTSPATRGLFRAIAKIDVLKSPFDRDSEPSRRDSNRDFRSLLGGTRFTGCAPRKGVRSRGKSPQHSPRPEAARNRLHATPPLASFVPAGSSAAAAALAYRNRWLRRGHPRPAKKKILMLGGTAFLGPAVVNAALAAGHEVTLWNRGKTNPGMFPDVEKLIGQRRRPRPDKPDDPPQDLTALAGRKWDAVVDTSAYFTGEVEDVCKVLAGNVTQYVFISSLSVYKTLEVDATPVDESSPALRVRRQVHDRARRQLRELRGAEALLRGRGRSRVPGGRDAGAARLHRRARRP
jgi:hypothetical protein